MSDPDWRIEPLTESLWSDFERLFGPQGASEGCWCMHWRTNTAKEYDNLRGNAAKECFEAKVEAAPSPVGIIAYDTYGEPRGWCSIAPRNTYGQRLARTGWLQKWDADEEKVWAIVCFYVAPQDRKQNLSDALIQGAVDHAIHSGADIIEAYPNDPSHREYSSGELYMGAHTNFLRNGFKEIERPTAGRVVVAHIIGKEEKI